MNIYVVTLVCSHPINLEKERAILFMTASPTYSHVNTIQIWAQQVHNLFPYSQQRS